MLLALLTAALTGCFDLYQEIRLEEDGSGTARLRYAAKPGMLASVLNQRGLKPEMLTDREAVEEHFDLREGVEVENVRMGRRDERQVVDVELRFEDIEAISDEAVRYEWRIEGAYKVLRMILEKRSGRQRRASDFQRRIASSMTGNGFHFKVHLPRRVVDSNAESLDWNVATWFVPIRFYMAEGPQRKVLYAKMEATWRERLQAWFDDLFER